MSRPASDEYAFKGVYHEVTPPERIVRTFEFEGMPGHVSLESMDRLAELLPTMQRHGTGHLIVRT